MEASDGKLEPLNGTVPSWAFHAYRVSTAVILLLAGGEHLLSLHPDVSTPLRNLNLALVLATFAGTFAWCAIRRTKARPAGRRRKRT